MNTHCPHLFQRYTYLGFCAECAPELHQAKAAADAKWQRLLDAFKAETGIDALSDWSRWEAWLDARCDPPAGSETVTLFGVPVRLDATLCDPDEIFLESKDGTAVKVYP